jgi:3-methylcrotonyl-CoA carboxylase alpha subunit
MRGSMFERILIANRGEVAARVARTCRRLGIETVGVHVESEALAAHVEACDESICIGTEASAYGDVDRIAEAAKTAQVAAVHPGYGVPRDELALARALEANGAVRIGPSAQALARAFDRMLLRTIAAELGVRVLPGSERAILEPNAALEDVDRIGYPVIVKSVRGAGEPLRTKIVNDVAELSEALEALGPLEENGGAILERWTERARHVEVQTVHDGKETLVLGDREVSLRRGDRRAFAESPASAIDQLHHDQAVRGALWDASAEIAGALGCAGLGSCHFVFDDLGVFYFVGMDVGLQVEHTTTEMCCNLDLVELEIAIASGQPIPPEVWRAEPTGCALQARVDASVDPRNDRPFESRVEAARWPPAPQGKVRIETGVKVGSAIASEHDALVASITTYAPTRHDALLMLDRILAEIHLAPVVTNVRLLRKALNHEALRAGQYDDGFLDRI